LRSWCIQHEALTRRARANGAPERRAGRREEAHRASEHVRDASTAARAAASRVFDEDAEDDATACIFRGIEELMSRPVTPSVRELQRDLAKRFAHVGEAAARKAGRLWDGSGSGAIAEPVERPTLHPDYPAGKPTSTWDNPIEKSKMIDGVPSRRTR
jgi:hypothetical protein